MPSSKETEPNFVFHPVSSNRFSDLAVFFEQHGNPNYCWCMRWRLKSAEFQRTKSKERRSKLQSLVQANIPIGVVAYYQDKVVGWCSIAPRETYPLLEDSTTLKRIDDLPVWSVVLIDPTIFMVSPLFSSGSTSDLSIRRDRFSRTETDR